ncbi:flagellar motor protein MotS [Paracerasibacillus soli]|uniref:Flagellar motor protein MotS n=1 Tax=Paracerasibacillus soli TaxID=480284 RepID=A0ABU5CQR0_9BACI|nr:flagellar motor protein MotS [Virgibacillus soli]MDY0408711.1 flagellar motor protein MotS [Virgibacillus soli]
MKRREVKRSKNAGAPKWMVTYSDMVTLVLVFFILLFSMSQIDSVKFQAVSDSFRNRMIFDFYPSPVPMENPTNSASVEENGKNANEFEKPQMPDRKNKNEHTEEFQAKEDALNKLVEDVDKYLDDNGLNSVITANRTDRGVVLVLQESVLFDTGEADILKSGKPFLNKVGSLLENIPNHVKVEGHTDNRPISNYRYPSNWDYWARASSVVRYFMEQHHFKETRFSVAGYADTRPVSNKNTPAGWSKNRRVEIVIMEDSSSSNIEE